MFTSSVEFYRLVIALAQPIRWQTPDLHRGALLVDPFVEVGMVFILKPGRPRFEKIRAMNAVAKGSHPCEAGGRGHRTRPSQRREGPKLL